MEKGASDVIEVAQGGDDRSRDEEVRGYGRRESFRTKGPDIWDRASNHHRRICTAEWISPTCIGVGEGRPECWMRQAIVRPGGGGGMRR